MTIPPVEHPHFLYFWKMATAQPHGSSLAQEIWHKLGGITLE